MALIESVDERLDVRYEPELLPPLRFPCDHRGVDSFRRPPDQEKRWRMMLSQAEVPGCSPTRAPGAGITTRWPSWPVPPCSSSGSARSVSRWPKAFGMRVIGVNRRGRTDSPDVDEVRPARFLGDLLPVAHGVVLTLPLTEETEGMIDAAAIARMRTGAVVIDIGGGGVVDEAALVQALEEGRLAGAALDVFATEPLPPDSALWDLPNVLVSPHTAGLSVHENERIVALFCENLRRYLAGAQLLSRVHPTLYY